MIFFKELKRRNVFKVASVYAVTSWLILQIVSVTSPYLHLPTLFGTTVTFVLVLGFPFACIFAWAFELTPEGLKRTHEVDEDESIRHETGQKINRMLLASVVLLVGFIAIDKSMVITSDDEPLSIAVLPFVDMSPDKTQEFFGDGIAEEILNSLAQIEQLKVIARTSSFSFKGNELSINEIAQRLNVKYVLEGSVRKYDEKLRITAQLIDTKEDYHLWSQTYDRPVQDVFAIQDEVTAAITQALSLELLDSDAHHYQSTQNAQAYELYLRAKALYWEYSDKSAAEAVTLLTKALKIDPSFYQAQAQLYFAYGVAFGYLGMSEEDVREKHHQIFTQLIVTREEFSDKYLIIGDYLLNYMQQYDLAQQAFEAAVDLNPSNVLGYMYLSNYYDGDKGVALMEKALSLDPNSKGVIYTAIKALIWKGENAKVKALINRLEDIAPHSSEMFHAWFRYWYLGHRDIVQALKKVKELQLNGKDLWVHYRLAQLYLQSGDVDKALSIHEEAIELSHQNPSLANYLVTLLAYSYTHLWDQSQIERANRLLVALPENVQQAIVDQANLLVGNYEKVLADPAYRQLAVERINNMTNFFTVEDTFAASFSWADSYYGNDELVVELSKKLDHFGDWCTHDDGDFQCVAMRYYSGHEKDTLKLLRWLQDKANNRLDTVWGIERFIKTDPAYLFLHEQPEFEVWANQFVDEVFLAVNRTEQ